MIKINLLPYHEREKKENLARQIMIIAGLFVLFILCLVWLQLYMVFQVKHLEAKLADSRQTLKILDAKVGDLEKFKQQKAELELKIGVIGTLEENRLLPVKTLDDLSMLVPQKSIWLVKIVQNYDSLTLEGIGRDNIVAADFMKTIENFAPIQSVDLVSSKKVEIAGITLQQFIFSCKMKKGF
ncbi:MAG: PilN domain-containing protein [Desulfobacterales bacterium]|nr:PilN domain-containing protein [Desulfobacterales bacterium]